ncbi:MAG: FtsQ-type POTRA domain-containing protein [Myxococcota bacterium]
MGLFRKIILSLIFVAAGVIVPVAYIWVTEGSALTIRTIHIKSGEHAKAEELQLYLRDYVGKPLYGVNLSKIREVVLRHPWVAEASVRRQPPTELEVEIRERKPIALIKKERLWVVDTLGVPFKTAESESELSLPLVSKAADVEILLTHTAVGLPGGAISEVSQYAKDQFKVLFVGGLEVVIGGQNSSQQWERLALVLKKLNDRAPDLAFVYLDDTSKRGQIAVRFKKG